MLKACIFPVLGHFLVICWKNLDIGLSFVKVGVTIKQRKMKLNSGTNLNSASQTHNLIGVFWYVSGTRRRRRRRKKNWMLFKVTFFFFWGFWVEGVERIIHVFFYVLLTVHLSTTLVYYQLDAQLFYFITRLLQSSTCFEQRHAHHQEVKFY